MRMTLIENKKARFNFELLDTFEAGIELFGYEVKSLRNKQGKLEGAHVIVRGGEAYLVGASIPAFQPANAPKSYDPSRTRRLLLSKKELDALLGAESKKGLTIVPISVYNSHGLLKLSLAIARGKKDVDKRETIKERDTKREIDREMKRQHR
jgi:SsrA-binding protein